jgi:acyl-coenzyme A thioesterase PaaI-like protein
MELASQFKKAQQSKFQLWILNNALHFYIPFNKPHGLKITKTLDNGVEILLPYKRKNLNHLKGIHACALAALCEYSCGITLATLLPQNEYRLIMKELKIAFHFQAKVDAIVNFTIDKKTMEEKILVPLKSEEKVFAQFIVEAYDTNKNHLCTATIEWQIKKWSSVKTKA